MQRLKYEIVRIVLRLCCLSAIHCMRPDWCHSDWPMNRSALEGKDGKLFYSTKSSTLEFESLKLRRIWSNERRGGYLRLERCSLCEQHVHWLDSMIWPGVGIPADHHLLADQNLRCLRWLLTTSVIRVSGYLWNSVDCWLVCMRCGMETQDYRQSKQK